MASTITAGNATNGLALSCDNTGILELKTGTGSGTTGLTIDASQNVTLPNAITLTGGVAGDFKMNSGYGSVATAYGCRAWVNFDGTGTVAIRASGNVSSITDGGTGDYTVNLTTAMPDANYVGTQSVERSALNAIRFIAPYVQSKTTSAYRVTTTSGADALLDVTDVYVAIFR
jgi:hypothetical protein